MGLKTGYAVEERQFETRHAHEAFLAVATIPAHGGRGADDRSAGGARGRVPQADRAESRARGLAVRGAGGRLL